VCVCVCMHACMCIHLSLHLWHWLTSCSQKQKNKLKMPVKVCTPTNILKLHLQNSPISPSWNSTPQIPESNRFDMLAPNPNHYKWKNIIWTARKSIQKISGLLENYRVQQFKKKNTFKPHHCQLWLEVPCEPWCQKESLVFIRTLNQLLQVCHTNLERITMR